MRVTIGCRDYNAIKWDFEHRQTATWSSIPVSAKLTSKTVYVMYV